MAITQVITTLPAAPDPATMSRDEFSAAAAAYVAAQKAMVPELNTWADEVNEIAAASVGDVATAIGAAGAATPVDADKFTFRQAASGLLKSVTLAGLKGLFAALAGSASQTFSVATATSAAHAVTKAQMEAAIAAGGSGEILNDLDYTSSTTYTKNADAAYIVVEVWGGGGGGGGAKAAGYITGGGGAGGYSRKKILAAAIGATETITIGAGGTAGSTAGGDGGTGGTTSFGAHLQATGGAGGQGQTGTTNGKDGGAGGVGSGGDVNLTGQRGGYGIYGVNVQNAFSGNGGTTTLGGEGAGKNSITGTGAGGAGVDNSGSGGGGAYGTTANLGGVGGSGRIRIQEYK